VRPGGTISLIGASAGGRGESNATPSLLPAVMREVRLQGVLVGPKSSFVAFAGALERWKLRPVVDARFELAEARAAFERLASGNPFGKVVVTL
jgi:NADPH:quinone reductase-like Zn-dependent oxidoreductase